NFAPNLVLAYDADDAGQNAALRIYQWEASYEIRLSVADLPPGQDPADLGLSDPARLAAAVAGARPFLEFRIERLLRAADLGSVEGRAAAAKGAVAVIAEHPDDLVRDQYLMQLAERVGIDVDRLRRPAPRPRTPRRPGPVRRGAGPRPGTGPRLKRCESPFTSRASSPTGSTAPSSPIPWCGRRTACWRPRLRSTRRSNAPEARCTSCCSDWRSRTCRGPTTRRPLPRRCWCSWSRRPAPAGWPLWCAPATTAPAT